MRRLTFLFILTVISLCHTSETMAHLHPQLQRFVQRDPMEYYDGGNTFEYLSGNPVQHVDPSGRNKCKIDFRCGVVTTIPFIGDLKHCDIILTRADGSTESGGGTGPGAKEAPHGRAAAMARRRVSAASKVPEPQAFQGSIGDRAVIPLGAHPHR